MTTVLEMRKYHQFTVTIYTLETSMRQNDKNTNNVCEHETLTTYNWSYCLKKLTAIWISLAISLLATPFSRAGELPTVALFESFPEAFRVNGGPYQGTLIDTFKALEDGMGMELERKITSWPRIMEYLGTDRYDFTFIFKVPAFESKVHYLGKLGCLADIIVPHQGVEINSVEDITGKNVAFIKNGGFARANENNSTFIKSPAPDSPTMMRLLANDRVDAIVIHSGHYNRLLNSHEPRPGMPENWRTKFGFPVVFQTYEVHLTLSKNSPHQDLIPKAKEAIKKQVESNAWSQALENYGMSFWPCPEE